MILTSKKELAKPFNKHCINTVDKIRGIKSKDIPQRGKTILEIVKTYENHPSILHIKNICLSSFYVKEKFCFYLVNKIELKKIIQRLNSIKATRIDTIPPKLIKVAVNFLTLLLTKSINSSIAQNIFLDLAKTSLVIPLDKGKPNKNDISNF